MQLCLFQIKDNAFLKQFNPRILSDIDSSEIYSCDVLVWNNNYNFVSSTLKNFPNLKLFINWGTDDANIKDEESIKKQIAIKKIDFWSQQSISEYIIMLMLNFEQQLNKNKESNKIRREIYNKKIGIIGLGKIGFKIASILKKSFNCTIFYHALNNYNLYGYNFVSPEELFKGCDYLIITVKSKNCVLDPKLLENANPNLVILNISRDSVLSFNYLLPYLKANKLRGFIGDVKKEGAIEKKLANVLILPKIGYQTKEAKQLKQNILLFYLKQYRLQEENKNLSAHLVRHGETEWNKLKIYQGTLNSSLTKKGKEGADKIGDFLINKNIENIFCSPLGRAQETANIIGKKLNLAPKIISAIREMDFGILQTRSQEKIKELFSDFFKLRQDNAYHKLFIPYPEGESYFDVYCRILPSILNLLVNYNNFVIVGHESVNRIIRGIITGRGLTEMVDVRQKNNEIIEINISANRENIYQI